MHAEEPLLMNDQPRRQSTMTLAVYRVAPDGGRTDIVPRHSVARSWLNTPLLSLALPLCRCARCVGEKQ